MDWNEKFSQRALRMKGSVIRELLALTAKPEIISFAGGLPDPATFPVGLFTECIDHVLKTNPSIALQYGETPGFKPLREELIKMSLKEGLKDVTMDNICVTTASQQGIDLVGKVLVDEGDTVIVEGPTYLAALQAWSVYGAKFETIPLDDDGMQTDMLEEKIIELNKKGIKPKFIYTIPTFQNPAGITMTMARRRKLLEIAHKYDIPIVEDNPYGDLRFKGEHLLPLAALDDRGIVIYLRTFSKILCPGLRLGWIVANKDVINKIKIAKESSDLCTPVLTQAAVAEFIKREHIINHIPLIIKSYSAKREAMIAAMKKYFPEGVKWTNAEGGMFIWATIPGNVDTGELFPKALELKVAYILGSAFYPKGDVKNCMRLNFSYPTHEQIDIGIKRLGELLKSI